MARLYPSQPNMPTPTPETPLEPESGQIKPTIQAFCNAIAIYEGGPGDANHRNNNPGNCRFSPVGYLPMYEPVKESPAGFAIFKDWDTGMLYLVNMIKARIHLHPNQTILQFMEVYSPYSDGNDPVKYADYLAKQLGVDNSFLMKNLV